MSAVMPESSPDPLARARKFQSQILQRLAGMQAQVAAALGLSESTISRDKEGFERLCAILAHLGFKVVDQTKVCVPPGEIAFLRQLYAKVSADAPWMLDDERSE